MPVTETAAAPRHLNARLGSLQSNPATPVCMYSRTTARCWCGATITLRTDGVWTHGAVVGLNCPQPR